MPFLTPLTFPICSGPNLYHRVGFVRFDLQPTATTSSMSPVVCSKGLGHRAMVAEGGLWDTRIPAIATI